MNWGLKWYLQEFVILNTNLKVLVIGRGGREHAILRAVVKSPLVKQAFIAPGNGATSQIATNVAIDELNISELVDFAKKEQIDLTIVGPESSLEAGIVDAFMANSLAIFGPKQAATRIESSKAYAKEIMAKYQINTADYAKFTDYDKAISYAKTINYPHVIKYDGLAAGKGVVICENESEMLEQIKIMLKDQVYGKEAIILEEFLVGEEFTLLSLVKDDKVYPLEVSRDFKRALDNDEGLNTGGMGAICPFNKISEQQKQEAIIILEQTASALVKEANNFTGVLYGGFIATDTGVKVIEYNARFGDPETEVVLQKLASDLVMLIIDILADKDVIIENDEKTYVGVCMASKGYPQSYQKGFLIENIDNEAIYHMGTVNKEGKIYTDGGRVLFATAAGENQEQAREKAYELVRQIKCDNLYYRTDIGVNDEN